MKVCAYLITHHYIISAIHTKVLRRSIRVHNHMSSCQLTHKMLNLSSGLMMCITSHFSL
jgi:predicted restriction endonuclease